MKGDILIIDDNHRKAAAQVVELILEGEQKLETNIPSQLRANRVQGNLKLQPPSLKN
ncbi:MAG: hypothetical protein R2764_05205 [Bacteroidales bacterium]